MEEKEVVQKILRTAPTTKIVLINSLNNFNTESLLAEISKCCSLFSATANEVINSLNTVHHFSYFLAEMNSDKHHQLRSSERYLFINCPRNSQIFLDFSKAADVLLNVSTVEHADLQNLNIRPADAINAIDETGEEMINLLRSQGCLKTLNAVVGWNMVPQNKHKDVKFYFKRLFEEEFPDAKTHFVHGETDVLRLLTDLQNLSPPVLEWRKERGYFLVDKYELSAEGQQKRVYLSGHLKNTMTTEELVHITGVGDFRMETIMGTIRNNHDSVTIAKTCGSSHPFELFSSEAANFVKETNS